MCRLLQRIPTVQRRPSWPLLDMATVVLWPNRMAPQDEQGSVQQSDKTGWLHAANAEQDIISYS
jgi:hypothetical protein